MLYQKQTNKQNMNTTMENVKELNLDSEKEAACKKKKKIG